MPHRILVVDDEENVRSMVSDYLEGRGLRVLPAGDVTQALKVIKQSQPHLALIDFLLPKKNGFALAEAIRKDDDVSQMPLIMMSGVFKNPKTAVEAREKYQVLDFLSKPIDLDRLYNLVTRALRDVPAGDDDLVMEEPDEAEIISSAPPEPDPRPASYDSAEAGVYDKDPPARGLNFRSASAANAARGGLTFEDSVRAPVPRLPSVGARPFPTMPEDGNLEDLPVALLISIARFDGLTGMLDLSANGTHRRVYVLRGQPIFMQSNAEGENVGALLLRRGRITEPDFERCLDYMKGRRRTLQQALLELRLASEQDLATAYKLLAGQLLPSAIAMPSGEFKWRESDAFVGRVPEGNFEPVSVLFEGIQNHVQPPQILKYFRGKEDFPLKRTTQFEPLLPIFKRAFSVNNVAASIDDRASYRDLIRARPNELQTIVPQLFALVTSGMTRLPDLTDDNAIDAAFDAAAAEAAGKPIPSTSQFGFESAAPMLDGPVTHEEENARNRVAAGYAQIMSKSFFEIFGVKPGEPNKIQLRDAYFKLAKQWHVDAFAGVRLGDAQAKLDEVFARITEAYETLSDPAKLSEYRVYLDRQAKGLPTDVNQILRAEQVFDQGTMALRRKDYPQARRLFVEATQLNSGEAIFWAHLGWVDFLIDPNQTTSRSDPTENLKKAIGIQENLPIAYQFLGQIYQARGKNEEAKRWYEKCLEFEPNNIEAARALRMMASRKEEKGAGLLSRFLSKK